MAWKRKEQEDGLPSEFLFSGRGYYTVGVKSVLAIEEVVAIQWAIKRQVHRTGGAQRIEIYECSDGRVVWCVDNLTISDLAGNELTPAEKKEYNYWTMMLPDEY